MTITVLPSAPLPSDSAATFNTKAFNLVAALNTFVTEANALGSAASADAVTAAAKALEAINAEAAAVGAANYKGAWSSLSGALAIPASVSHLGKVWILTESVANVTTELPGTSSKWLSISISLDSPGVIGAVTPNIGNFSTVNSGIGNFTSLNSQNTFGFKNRIINGDMRIDQRNAGAAQTLTAGISAYTVDRWLGYCAGANVTGQRVSNGSGGYNYQYTGAASVTAINHIQRIESVNSYDLAGSTATLSVDLANSLLTTVTWTAYYANAADNFSANTQIATGSFTVTSSVTKYSTQISIPSAATTGIQITLSVGSQTSGTWTIGKVQLEKGSTATSFDVRDYGRELMMCQRYYSFAGATLSGLVFNANYAGINFPVTMRATPTVTVIPSSGSISGVSAGTIGFYATNTTTSAATWTASAEL